MKSKRGNPERDDGIISYQLKGAYTKLNRHKPRIGVKPLAIPAKLVLSRACPELAVALPALRSFSEGGSLCPRCVVEGMAEWVEGAGIRKRQWYNITQHY